MSEEAPKCPVDHTKFSNKSIAPHPIPEGSSSNEEAKCPVDHTARAKWAELSNAKPAGHPTTTTSQSDDKCPVDHTARAKWAQLGGDKSAAMTIDGSTIPTAIEHSSDTLPDQPKYVTDVALPEDREISSIPRTGSDSNWIYPSQKQFFEAMKRKNWNPEADVMAAVVPIHNAVNERAWYQILKWEEGEGSEKCGGIQLTSFKGDSKKLTPKAALKWALLGYQKPFDRHDWVIDRCGTEVEYVIDFYSGKPNPLTPGMASFYLDVRPKLNSFEGIRLRVKKFFGF